MDQHIPLTQFFSSLRVMPALQSGITLTLSFVATSMARGLISTRVKSAKRIQKTALSEVMHIPVSIEDVECTGCVKFHLMCRFKFSGMSYLLIFVLFLLPFSNIIVSFLLLLHVRTRSSQRLNVLPTTS